jgi:hypothetical protein
MSCPRLAVVPRGTTSRVAAAGQEEALCVERHVGAGCGVSGGGSPERHHSLREAAAAPAERCSSSTPYRPVYAPHTAWPPMPQSSVPAAAGHTQATGRATNDACLGAWLQAEQALIRKLQFMDQLWCEAGLREDFA